MQVFGAECSSQVMDAGREAMRLAHLAPECSETRTTSQDFLRLKGLSEFQIIHTQSVFSNILKDVFSQTNQGVGPEQEIAVIPQEGGKQPTRRPISVYTSSLDRALYDRA